MHCIALPFPRLLDCRWRGHYSKAEAAEKTERREKAFEAGWKGRDWPGSILVCSSTLIGGWMPYEKKACVD
jgi:hypothetical protein